MRRTAMLLLCAAAVGLSGTAVAHEGHKHKTHKMMGTVKAVHADMNHVEITVKDGKTDGFYVDANTEYLKGSTKLSLAALTPGTRVVVDAKTEGQKMVATLVRVGGSTKAAASGDAHKH